MIGFDSRDQATDGYLSNYEKGWKLGPTSDLSMTEFKDWLANGDNTKPYDPEAVRRRGTFLAAQAERRAQDAFEEEKEARTSKPPRRDKVKKYRNQEHVTRTNGRGWSSRDKALFQGKQWGLEYTHYPVRFGRVWELVRLPDMSHLTYEQVEDWAMADLDTPDGTIGYVKAPAEVIDTLAGVFQGRVQKASQELSDEAVGIEPGDPVIKLRRPTDQFLAEMEELIMPVGDRLANANDPYPDIYYRSEGIDDRESTQIEDTEPPAPEPTPETQEGLSENLSLIPEETEISGVDQQILETLDSLKTLVTERNTPDNGVQEFSDDLFDDNQRTDEGADTRGSAEGDAEVGRVGPDGTGVQQPTARSRPAGRNSRAEREPAEGSGTRPGAGRAEQDGDGDRTGSDPRRATGAVPDAGNYRISDADQLGTGGPLEKARANLEAIRVVKALSRENRGATADEQAALVKYVGWGDTQIANNLFPSKREPTGSWKEIHDELQELLTESEYSTARRSTRYAHYTSKTIIDSIYTAVRGFGLERGNVIEGGMGTGNFVGLIPEGLNLNYTGIEFDGISAKVAKALYPNSGVIHGDFTKIGLPQGHFDMAIGNPPFGDDVIKSDPKYRRHKFLMHDYFIAKQLDAVRPGGIAVFVTSKGTMDKANTDMRRYLADRAKFLGAIRLPQTAFKENAGTEVVTDVLFFQKRQEQVDLRVRTNPG